MENKSAPFSMWQPFNYRKTFIRSPLSLLSIKLSIPNSLNCSLYNASCRPHITLVALPSVFFLAPPHLFCVTFCILGYCIHTRIGCSIPNVASPMWNRVVLSHDLGAIRLLMQPRSELAFLAAAGHC